MPNLSDLIDRTTELFSLPDVYLRVQEVLADPEHCLDDVVAAVRNDPAMTASLLRIANSAFFGLPSRVNTVQRAINLLGLQQVHDLLLAQAVSGAFRGSADDLFDMRRFWQRSVLCAALSRVLARRCHVLDAERLFVYGLLHDIGHMIMYQRIPAAAADALAHAIEHDMPLHEAEEATLGFSHAEVGAALCRRWRLPPGLCETLRHHVRPQCAIEHPLEAAIVHVGAAVADCSDTCRVRATTAVDARTWQLLQHGPDCLAVVRAEAQTEAAEAMEVFFGHTRQSA